MKKPGQKVIEFPLNFRPFLELAALAQQLDVPLDLHAEPVDHHDNSHEAQVFGGVALLYQRFPRLKLILSHTGMTHAANARALLDTYPRLMMNLKAVPPGRRLRWDHLGPVINADNRLFEDWAELLEAMPERFMIGTDARFGSDHYPRGRYEKKIRRLRRLLGSLDEDAARMIAHDNARRYFTW
jgi:predicted TIM-barrel fold metal-dependent hydrolase